MNKQEMYQQALAKAVEQAVNGKNAVREYVTRLAQMKVEQILRKRLGKEFECKELEGCARLVAVGYDVKDDFWDSDSYAYNSDVIALEVWFAKDVTELLGQKGVTDAEKEVLKVILRRYKEAGRSTYFNYYHDKNVPIGEQKHADNMREALNKLQQLKNNLQVATVGYYYYDFDNVMRDDFMQRSLSYNGQSIL